MKRRLDRTIKRLKKEQKIVEKDELSLNKLNPYEIKVFRDLRDKYNLSINENSKKYDNKTINYERRIPPSKKITEIKYFLESNKNNFWPLKPKLNIEYVIGIQLYDEF